MADTDLSDAQQTVRLEVNTAIVRLDKLFQEMRDCARLFHEATTQAERTIRDIHLAIKRAEYILNPPPPYVAPTTKPFPGESRIRVMRWMEKTGGLVGAKDVVEHFHFAASTARTYLSELVQWEYAEKTPAGYKLTPKATELLCSLATVNSSTGASPSSI